MLVFLPYPKVYAINGNKGLINAYEAECTTMAQVASYLRAPLKRYLLHSIILNGDKRVYGTFKYDILVVYADTHGPQHVLFPRVYGDCAIVFIAHQRSATGISKKMVNFKQVLTLEELSKLIHFTTNIAHYKDFPILSKQWESKLRWLFHDRKIQPLRFIHGPKQPSLYESVKRIKK